MREISQKGWQMFMTDMIWEKKSFSFLETESSDLSSVFFLLQQ